jgi:hypothetical protein
MAWADVLHIRQAHKVHINFMPLFFQNTRDVDFDQCKSM